MACRLDGRKVDVLGTLDFPGRLLLMDPAERVTFLRFFFSNENLGYLLGSIKDTQPPH